MNTGLESGQKLRDLCERSEEEDIPYSLIVPSKLICYSPNPRYFPVRLFETEPLTR
jgi:hypothetical protein